MVVKSRFIFSVCLCGCLLCVSVSIITLLSTLSSQASMLCPALWPEQSTSESLLLDPGRLSHKIWRDACVLSAVPHSQRYRTVGQPVKVTLYQHLGQSKAQPAWNWYSSKSLANYWSGASVVTAENVQGTTQEDDKYFRPATYSTMCFGCSIISSLISVFCSSSGWVSRIYSLKHWSCHCNGCLKKSF